MLARVWFTVETSQRILRVLTITLPPPRHAHTHTFTLAHHRSPPLGPTGPAPVPLTADNGMEWLLHPLNVSTFLSDHWETAPVIVRRQGGLGGAAKGAGSAGSAGAGGGKPDSSSASGESGSSLRNYYDVLYVQMPGAVLLILLLNDSITIESFYSVNFSNCGCVSVCLCVWLCVPTIPYNSGMYACLLSETCICVARLFVRVFFYIL